MLHKDLGKLEDGDMLLADRQLIRVEKQETITRN